MGIDAKWVTVTGESKQEVFDPRQCLTSLATSRWSQMNHTKCLQFIDPWGDAVFNQGQVPHLLAELQAELPACSDPEIKSHLAKVIHLVERAVDQMHTFVRFVGD